MKKYILISAIVALLTISLVSGEGYYKVNKYKNNDAVCHSDSDCFGGLVCRSSVCSERMMEKNNAPRIVTTKAVGNSLLNAARTHNSVKASMKQSVLAPTTGLYAYEQPKAEKEDLKVKKTAFSDMKTGQVVSNKLAYGKNGAKTKSKSVSGVTGMTIAGGRCDIGANQFPPCDFGLKCHPRLKMCVSAYH